MFTSMTETNPASDSRNPPSTSFVLNDSSINHGEYFLAGILAGKEVILLHSNSDKRISKVVQAPGFIRGINPKSQIENPQAPAFIRGVNLKSQIENLKSIDGIEKITSALPNYASIANLAGVVNFLPHPSPPLGKGRE